MKTYMNRHGKYQAFFEILDKRIPDIGYTENDYVNVFIAVKKLYFDAYNNGGRNIQDNLWDIRQRIDPYLGSQVRPEAFVDCNFAQMEKMMNCTMKYLQNKNLDFPVYEVWANSFDSVISFVEPKNNAKLSDSWVKTTFGSKTEAKKWYRGYADVSDSFMKDLGTVKVTNEDKPALDNVIDICKKLSEKNGSRSVGRNDIDRDDR